MFTTLNSFPGSEGGCDTGETCIFDLKSQLFFCRRTAALCKRASCILVHPERNQLKGHMFQAPSESPESYLSNLLMMEMKIFL